MRIHTITNDEMTIQADMNKDDDFEKAMQVAQAIVDGSDGMIDLSSACETEGWVQLGMVWDHYQAKELRGLYAEAKKAARK